MILQQRAFASFAIAVLALILMGIVQPDSASAQCGELIVNGDFEAGNTGFTSQYTFTTTSLCQPAAMPS